MLIAASTSLTCNGKLEVDLCSVSTQFSCPPLPSHTRVSWMGLYGISTLFSHPPHSSHATASQRWIFMAVRRHSHVLHLLCTQEPAGQAFMVSQCRSRILHLPCTQQRAKSGSSWRPDTILVSPTSLACNRKLEVDLYGVSMLFLHPPPP